MSGEERVNYIHVHVQYTAVGAFLLTQTVRTGTLIKNQKVGSN